MLFCFSIFDIQNAILTFRTGYSASVLLSKNEKQKNILKFFDSDLGYTAREDYYTHFDPSQTWGGAKTGDPREKTTWPSASRTWLVSHVTRIRLDPQRWDDALKISVLNHSATGPPILIFDTSYSGSAQNLIVGLCPKVEKRKTNFSLLRQLYSGDVLRYEQIRVRRQQIRVRSKYVFEDVMGASNTVEVQLHVH